MTVGNFRHATTIRESKLPSSRSLRGRHSKIWSFCLPVLCKLSHGRHQSCLDSDRKCPLLRHVMRDVGSTVCPLDHDPAICGQGGNDPDVLTSVGLRNVMWVRRQSKTLLRKLWFRPCVKLFPVKVSATA